MEKWYIVNFQDLPLIWNHKILNFDTKESAERFLRRWISEIEEDYDWFCEENGISIQQKDNFKRKETLNCTNKLLIYSSGVGEIVDI